MKPTKPLSLPEFVTMLAMMISIIALSIDAILPAFEQIGIDFSLADPNDAQLVLSAMFFGFAVGQIGAGPLSDCYGRKPIIYIGYAIFIAGCLISITATNFSFLLFGRVLQGLGAAAPRIVSGYTIASGIIFGAFLGYLNSAQQIFQITYKPEICLSFILVQQL